MNPVYLLFYLVAGHFVADYPLQGDTTAREKNPGSTTELQKHVPWYFWMTAHCFAHALVVAVITRSVIFTTAEFFSHFALDYAKCKNRITIHHDQVGHLMMKLLYSYIFALLDLVPGQLF